MHIYVKHMYIYTHNVTIMRFIVQYERKYIFIYTHIFHIFTLSIQFC